MEHPYSGLSEDKFWKTGVTLRGENATFDTLWSPRFKIKPTSKIISTGSCFAQHVTHWLTQNNFQYLASEHDNIHKFSFALGNIYTPAMLKQWLEVAFKNKDISDFYIVKDGSYYDILRPTVQREGFKDLETLLSSRKRAINEMVNYIQSADIFIFTMGLTETWLDKSGVVYPICPGTICGTFDSKKHGFRNYTTQEVINDLNEINNIIRSANKNIKLLLTISPIPLTATASNNHVLSATTYSKSVLRAAAGDFCKNSKNADYFPSYEIISSPATKGVFFEQNMRNVKPEGVNFVMAHFESGISHNITSSSLEGKTPTINEHNDTDICDDVLLANFQSNITYVPDYCLIGDSQIGKLAESFQEQKIPFIGGKVMNASAFASQSFHVSQEEYFIPLENKESRKVWENTLSLLERCPKDEKPTILTNIGIQTYFNVQLFAQWLQKSRPGNHTITRHIEKYVSEIQKKQFAIINLFTQNGYKVVVISDPPIQQGFDTLKSQESIFVHFEKTYAKTLTAIGAELFNCREWINNSSKIDQPIWNYLTDGQTPDILHGNSYFYSQLAKEIKSKY
jgi:hypothetical protein